jgi:hypothetical protein
MADPLINAIAHDIGTDDACVGLSIRWPGMSELGATLTPEAARKLAGLLVKAADRVTQGKRFACVSCSQCGRTFGPGNHGYSECASHRRVSIPAEAAAEVAQ